ncbi:hypothetical protein AGABI2DRAFT_205388 [Agaricus bisporus var. bisporus H97]|uniref:hypothetical protein n=1 Tax=Agaricus bisporus var. bisporus (strain H97 / ATCC MYA-4626 / FGSC 10389) TaxID=936046 RepID=UPI00029F6003|nr:hypothetical protein AGABI2DRAFT_205388 [Agaricus bisporus var. bisporus H97]EKV46255.1 hypothetical protein AGABI2DRAFT_205388 [Agaricus bisporus var. bisporus H97]
MSRYHNSIHTPVFRSQVSDYSSLSGALTPPSSQFTDPRRHRVPQCAAKPAGQPVSEPISFDYIGYLGQGVRIVDFSALSANALANMVASGNDLVLARTGVKQINLRISWPGYEHLNWSFSTPASPSMTRIQLGASIGMHLWRFVEKAMSSSTSRPEWKIGDKAIEFEKIILVALYSLGSDVWQADLAVDF